MKFVWIFAILVIVVANVLAQERCPGLPRDGRQLCSGPRDEGHRRGNDCARHAMNVMWYYNASSNSCIRMRYLGCGGNHNRYCSNAHCMRMCRRRQ